MHLHLAPHIGSLAETRDEPDVEPNPKMELVDPSRREMLAKRVLLTNSDLSQIPGKPRSIISLLPSKQLILYML
jgi:hypothetical protein